VCAEISSCEFGVRRTSSFVCFSGIFTAVTLRLRPLPEEVCDLSVQCACVWRV
jgi:hypothetical protein